MVELESRVLAGVRERLLACDLVVQVTEASRIELEGQTQEDGAYRSTLEDQLASTWSRITRLVDQIEGEATSLAHCWPV